MRPHDRDYYTQQLVVENGSQNYRVEDADAHNLKLAQKNSKRNQQELNSQEGKGSDGSLSRSMNSKTDQNMTLRAQNLKQ